MPALCPEKLTKVMLIILCITLGLHLDFGGGDYPGISDLIPRQLNNLWGGSGRSSTVPVVARSGDRPQQVRPPKNEWLLPA
jgi:hypothetical protein